MTQGNMMPADERGGTEILYDYLKEFEPGSEFTTEGLLDGPKVPRRKKAIYSAISRLVDHGVLTQVGTAHYKLTKKVETFGDNYHFKKRRRVTKKANRAPVKAQSDMDVIEELLDVMARAEPVLKRMRKMQKTLKDLL